MSEGVAGKAVFVGDEIATPGGFGGEGRLAKIGIGVKKAQKAANFYVFELSGDVGDGIVPANLAIGDDVEAGFHLVGDGAADHFVLGVEDVGGGALAAVEGRDGAAQELKLEGVADARIAAGAGEVQTGGSGAHGRPAEIEFWRCNITPGPRFTVY